MQKHSLTILTDPILYREWFLKEFFARLLRKIKYVFIQRKYHSHPIYRGHFAVTRSLIDGLTEIEKDFNYNIYFSSNLNAIVVVLANVEALKQAIKLKEKGKISKIIAGPNIVNFASDYNSIISNDCIDIVIVPSKPIKSLYVSDCPQLRTKIRVWPSGVDIHYWNSTSNHNMEGKKILVYEKQAKGPVGPIQPYVNYIKQLGYDVEVIEYGKYEHGNFKKLLLQSQLMIGFVTDESQGLAWAEAWACNVPTFIWWNDFGVCNGRKYPAESAPYLCSENGVYFKDFDDFKVKFSVFENKGYHFNPREWVLKNMSDSISAKLLLNIIEGE